MKVNLDTILIDIGKQWRSGTSSIKTKTMMQSRTKKNLEVSIANCIYCSSLYSISYTLNSFKLTWVRTSETKLKCFYLNIIGDYKVSGRDSLVFLVDASKEMFVKGENGELSNFDMTMQVYSKLNLNSPLSFIFYFLCFLCLHNKSCRSCV